jgi:hypothetical protein
MTLNEERILRNHIKNIIRENFFNDFTVSEKSKKDNSHNVPSKSRKKTSDAVKKNIPGKRAFVISALKNPGLDNAPFAYRLWPKKDKANARSQFYKCRDGEVNDNGDVYSFTDKEIVRLYSMLTNSKILTVK